MTTLLKVLIIPKPKPCTIPTPIITIVKFVLNFTIATPEAANRHPIICKLRYEYLYDRIPTTGPIFKVIEIIKQYISLKRMESKKKFTY